MKKSRLLGATFAFLVGFCIVDTVTAASITIGTYVFAGPEAFPTDATYVSGQTTYIEHPPGTSWNPVSGNSTTDLDAALTGYDLTFGVDGEGIVVDLTFGNASIVNGAGSDLVLFETVFEENFDLAIYVGESLSGNLTYWSVSTGLTVGDVVGSTNTAMLNAAEIDLSDFGIGLGEAVSKIRLYTQPVGVPPEDSTAGADIVAVGALHVVPIPPTLYLFGSGLLWMIGLVRRRKAFK
jgi:hypothetical protein